MAFITTTAASIASGGTINGDITITGDLKVEGGGSFTYDEIIEGTLQTQGKLTVTSSSGLDIINTGNNTVFHIPSSAAYTFGTQTNNHMSMWTNNTERMRITNAGKVGINVTAPDHELHIKAADSGHSIMTIESGSVNHQAFLVFEADRASDGDYVGNLEFTVDGSNKIAQITALRGSGDTVGDLRFDTSAVERMPSRPCKTQGRVLAL